MALELRKIHFVELTSGLATASPQSQGFHWHPMSPAFYWDPMPELLVQKYSPRKLVWSF